MLDAGRVQRIHVVDVDDRVQSVSVYELGDTVQKMVAVGMGGTRFDVSFEWLAANVPDAAAVVLPHRSRRSSRITGARIRPSR